MRKSYVFVLAALFTSYLMFAILPDVPPVEAGAVMQSAPPAAKPPLPPPLHPTEPPKILHKVQPQYPPDAREKRVQGPVVLQVVVDPSGQPEAVRLMSGDPLLAIAAENAVRQWRWEPTLINGKAVTVETKVTINFKLDGKKKTP